MSEDTNIATKQDNALTDANIDSLASEFVGSIQVRQQLIKVPRLKLTQAMSKQNAAGLARPGEFFSDLKSTNYGKSVTVIPLLISESASLVDKNTSKMTCYSKDLMTSFEGASCKQCPYGQYWADWGTKENKKVPECKVSLNLVCVVDGEKKPIITSFRKKNMRGGKELMNKVINDRLPFASKYVLVSKEINDPKGTHYVVDPFAIQQLAMTNDEIREILPLAKSICEASKKNQLEHEEENDSESSQSASPQPSTDDDFTF